jgi:hypothetical protein
MDHKGVPYARTLDGNLADPATATHRNRGYRCLACGGYVHLRKGPIRAAHFAHYVDRQAPCAPETVLHEAAKLRLRDLLRNGLTAFRIQVSCPGHRTAHDHHVPCAPEHRTEQILPIPPFDSADVEVTFGPYRLDAAAMRAGRLVLGLEVHQSHEVDEAKRAALMRTRLPWLEVDACTVLESPLPWPVRSSSLGSIQCRQCSQREDQAREERRRLEGQRRADEQRKRRDEALKQLESRVIQVAWDGRGFRTPAETTVGDALTCPACKARVRTDLIAGTRVFLHAEGMGVYPVSVDVR